MLVTIGVVVMVRSALTVQEKAEIWRGYRAGNSLRSISRALGRSIEALRALVAGVRRRSEQLEEGSGGGPAGLLQLGDGLLHDFPPRGSICGQEIRLFEPTPQRDFADSDLLGSGGDGLLRQQGADSLLLLTREFFAVA